MINTYVNVNRTGKNPFDHPTDLNNFDEENTLEVTIESLNSLIIDRGDNLKIYLFAAATQEDTRKDKEIRKKTEAILADCRFESLIFTNSDIKDLRESSGFDFISAKGYPELRNCGFIFPSIMDEDIIIQIDDDEVLRPGYLDKMKEVLLKHPDKFIFTAPYEKNGTVRINTRDPLVSWKKFSLMDRDMVRFYEESSDAQESLFGFGGNMVVRREFAELVPYPPEVPRGEDFSMLLASRLVYENGNPLAGIEKGAREFRSFFLPYREMTIIHRPPAEAKKDFLKYFENNMKRFIMEWGIFIKQKGLTLNKMENLSFYIREMIGHDNMEDYLTPIFDEMTGKYDSKKIAAMKNRLFELISYYRSNNRWTKYRKTQQSYIDGLKRLKTETFRKEISKRGFSVTGANCNSESLS